MEWQNRPLSTLYPIVFIDAVHFSVRDDKIIRKLVAYVVLGVKYKCLNRQKSVFLSDTAILKALYLVTQIATKKWAFPLRNWGKVYGELSIMYADRIPE